jgi:hypothetical protein
MAGTARRVSRPAAPFSLRFLENWSCGLHRVIFYGDHTRDVERFCRFMKIRILREGEGDLRDVPGLEWVPRIHA